MVESWRASLDVAQHVALVKLNQPMDAINFGSAKNRTQSKTCTGCNSNSRSEHFQFLMEINAKYEKVPSRWVVPIQDMHALLSWVKLDLASTTPSMKVSLALVQLLENEVIAGLLWKLLERVEIVCKHRF